ncbi:MAG: lytic transglycosylase domain-containing protein [Acetobacter fabarum]|nr:lytic transglycosylase domain-containing protein [Acetobacter fabarum]MCI1909755.1 lytic transglycosylase domain-containing protein [Acetobacter fabarum]MCI1928097.1 lytic transglycosylase domain-containing protein [Acetobacter fabarum]MCI1948275.1 lytic transglycosylase domain-containing protein [Acetobacter fabarum]MCI1989261.1 lytic transglycosylase domain-containing protein [Acetobacter fabarum]
MTGRQPFSRMQDCCAARNAPIRFGRGIRGVLALGLLAVLAACAGQPGGSDTDVPIAQEAEFYRSHARSYYAPPGPAEDPWGPYIREASKRFDVPEEWVRAVIQQESGGKLFHDGQLVTSGPGAMGLMQLMPPTYDEMRAAYNLGGDAYEPHDNIMAGTAYLRQLYDVYGSPGFLAAYNAGPGRLEDFITRNRTLPRETRNYVASIGRRIVGISPLNRSQADMQVASHDSFTQRAVGNGAGRNAGGISAVQAAWSVRQQGSMQPVQVADAIGDDTADTASAPAATYGQDWHPVSRKTRVDGLTESPSDVRAIWAKRLGATAQTTPETPVQVAQAGEAETDEPAYIPAPLTESGVSDPEPARLSVADGRKGGSLRLIPMAHAEPAPLLSRKVRGVDARNWAIQVGAFGSVALAQQASGRAQHQNTSLSGARVQIAVVQAKKGRLYRARLTNLSHTDAVGACRKLSGCVVISPESHL